MKQDRVVRSLAQLERTASTARVLNLNAIAKRMAPAGGEQPSPLFRNALLNRAIFIKHRLRRDEHDFFADYRLQATKVVLPIEPDDLSVGAYSFFIDQKGYAETLEELLGRGKGASPQDRTVLQILNESPTLDPFVLREQLRRHGMEPSTEYFDIGPADLSRMVAFVGRQVAPLANMSVGSRVTEGPSQRFARKLLSSSIDQETEPLRHTLRMEAHDYKEGAFCWKAFLYYKWCLEELTPHVAEVMREISQVRVRPPAPAELRAEITQSRERLRDGLLAACEAVRATIKIYDDAYRQLVVDQDPIPFRQFLLTGPALFSRLGEGLGAVQHIVSYWRFRFPAKADTAIVARDLLDILEDFLQPLEAFEDVIAEPRPGEFQRAMLI